MLNTVKVGDYFGKYQRLFISFFVLSDLRLCADKDKRKINSGGEYEETNNEQAAVKSEAISRKNGSKMLCFRNGEVRKWQATCRTFRSPR